MVNLSVAIITKNEERNLPDCLKSVSFAEDIVVVDSGSTDRTIEIAKEFGCRVFIEDWKGEGLQRNFAEEKCRHEWIVILDADERIPEETKVELLRVISSPDSDDAYTFRRKNIFNGKWIRHSGWYPDEVIRLYKKTRCTIVNRNIHLEIKVNGRIGKISSPIIHFPIVDIESILQKINRYSSLGAKDLHDSGMTSSPAKAVTHMIAAFLKTYFLKLGFLDGKEGLIIAFSGSVNTFYKYIKLLELQRKGNG